MKWLLASQRAQQRAPTCTGSCNNAMGDADKRPLSVAVPGASGFVGRALVQRLAGDTDFRVRACYRSAPGAAEPNAEVHLTGDLLDTTGWAQAFAGADAVVHTAARAHILNETGAEALAAFRRVNTQGTLAVAQAAAEAGVRRFVFLSTIGVHGDVTAPGRAFSIDDDPAPHSPYAQSKLEAEAGLQDLARESGLEVVILRIPLVHGAGAPGNFARLLGLVRRQLPLPLGSVDNRRSLIGIDNLCAAITACVQHPAARDRTFLVSDQDDLSTPDIIRALAAGLGLPIRLLPCPVALLTLGGAVLGRGDEVRRLVSSLRVDSGPISEALGWRPAVTARAGLMAMAQQSRTTS